MVDLYNKITPVDFKLDLRKFRGIKIFYDNPCFPIKRNHSPIKIMFCNLAKEYKMDISVHVVHFCMGDGGAAVSAFICSFLEYEKFLKMKVVQKPMCVYHEKRKKK